ncbi:heat-inducible transcription repressor HrcA [Hydrogenimonas sp.]|nr:heat-inducible transcription repressor HrcA [Hydrogenimonas sp.]
MKEKYEAILETVVKTFLETHEPIGSAMLKEKLPFEIAPATIRYYFNKMVERGELAQLHKSSGRIPTESTMKRYWRKHLKELELLSDAMSEVARISEKENLFILFKPVTSNRLNRIERVGRDYLILAFERDEYVIRYQSQLESFLNDLVGYELEEVKRIARDVGIMSLYYKMRAKNDEEVTSINEEALISFAGRSGGWGKRNIRAFLDGDIIEELEYGLYFDPLLPKGFMALRVDSVVERKPMKMLCIGAIDRDFTKIFKEV